VSRFRRALEWLQALDFERALLLEFCDRVPDVALPHEWQFQHRPLYVLVKDSNSSPQHLGQTIFRGCDVQPPFLLKGGWASLDEIAGDK